MKNEPTAKTIRCANRWVRVVLPSMLLAALALGTTPETALADQIVIVNQPDDYVVLDPIYERRRAIVEGPEPSWVVIGHAPPPLRVEVRPPQPFAGAIWVSGYWWWSGARYVWIGGHYVQPVAGYRFVAPRWVFSGGCYYHVRGHYRPAGATVRHTQYRDYRQAGYYGQRHPRGYRHTTYRRYPHGHGGRYVAYDARHRGYGKGYYRDDDDDRGRGKGYYRDDYHRGRGKGYDRDDDDRGRGKGYDRDDDDHRGRGKGYYRDDERRGRGDELRAHGNAGRGRGTPTARASSSRRPSGPSRVAPVARRQSAQPARSVARRAGR